MLRFQLQIDLVNGQFGSIGCSFTDTIGVQILWDDGSMLPQGIPRDLGQRSGLKAIALWQLHVYLKAPDLLQKLSYSSSRQALSGVQGVPNLG